MFRILGLCVLFCSTPCWAAETWKAGVGRECITPPEPMPMAGYASRGAAHATGKLHDLWAKSLILEDSQGERCVLVTLDLCGIDAALASRVCEQLHRECNLQRKQIWLATSHTHSGPVVAGNLRPMHYMLFGESDRKLVDAYAAFLMEKIVASVKQAEQDLGPSELRFGSGSESIAVNRRTNLEKDVPALRATNNLAGPSDHSVPVLLISRKGIPYSVVFGYACHSTTLSGMEWSADYPGYAQAELEERLPNCQAMFWAGCGGDQNPLPRRTVELAQQYGRRLASAVMKTMQNELPVIDAKLKTDFQLIPVPFGELPTREQLENDRQSENPYVSARALAWLQRLEAGESIPRTYNYPVATWRLGDSVDRVAIGGEVVVDYALSIKGLPAAKRATWVMAYANDVMAYIPSQRVLAEGGYEGGGAMVYYGQPTHWAAEIEPLILGEVERQLAQ
jgi:neutral ceramidase